MSLGNSVKVSVIVPVYNNEVYLRECMESIINQTLQEIEIICINDGSIDNSLDILKSYAEIDERIRMIDKDNTGYGHSMNIGMEAAIGEFIGIVESDDYILPEMYETLYSIAKQEQLDFIKADFKRFLDNEDESRHYQYVKVANSKYYNKVLDPENNRDVLIINRQSWCCLYNTEYLRKYSIRHNETPGASYQDNGFYIKACCWARRVYMLNKPFYMHRLDNPNSSINNKEKVFDIKKEYDLTAEYLKKHFSIGCEQWELFDTCKFKSYQFTLSRIGDEFKKEFMEHFNKEFPNNFHISVIIPAFNVAETLSQCLESVIAQTLKDIEIICINDGSTDETMDILNRYAHSDARIRVLSQSNMGAGFSRNIAIDTARGEYVVFMDADDYYPDTDILYCLYNKAVKNNALMCGGCFSNINNDTINIIYNKTYKGYTFEEEGIIEYKDYQFDYGFHRFIYSRNMLIEHNIRFPHYKRYQDPPFLVNAMIAAGSFYAIPKVVYCYRDGLITWNTQKVMELMKGLRDVLKISSKHSYSKLHVTTYCRIANEYKYPIANHYDIKNQNFVSLIDELSNSIDLHLLEIEKEKYNPIRDLLIDNLQSECDNLKTALELERTELMLTRLSWTFRIGRFITYIPRKIRSLINKQEV